MRFMLGVIGALVIVALVLFFTGCTGVSAAKDCGEDMQCFADAAETCTPAKVRVSEEGMSLYSEILGGTTDACKVYYEFDMGALGKRDLTCTVGTTQEIDLNDPEELCDYCSGSMLQGLC